METEKTILSRKRTECLSSVERGSSYRHNTEIDQIITNFIYFDFF